MNKPNPLNVLVSDRDALLAVTLPLIGWAHSAEEIAEVADLAEATLDRMWMPKGRRKGITAGHTSKGPAYPGEVIGTTVTLQRAADGWRINGFAAAYASSQRRGKLQLRISPKQEAAAVGAMRAACGIVVTRAASKATSVAYERSVTKGTTQTRSRRLKQAP